MTLLKVPAYSAEELDLQYNARATVEDATFYMREYGLLTSDAKMKTPHLESIAYGSTPEELLDVYPTDRPNAPVFVFIHGGYWRALSKDDSGFMAPTFTESGSLVVAVDYALAPAVSLDTIVHQVRTALSWISKHIAEYGGDPERIYVCGSSAGGHLVGMLFEEGWHREYEVPLSVIKGAVPISGLFDLRPLVATHINEWLRHDENDAARNSPILRPAAVGCPMVIAYAERDTDEFKRQSMLYAEAWRSAGNDAITMEVRGTNHFDVLYDLMDSNTALCKEIFTMMRLR